jgi:thioredoxin 1
MRSIVAWKWPAILAGLLVAETAMFYYAPCGCLRRLLHGEAAATSQSNDEGDNMSVTHTSSKIQHATVANFRNLVLQAKTPVLVDFYADWCGPCQRLTPLLEELAGELPGARIVKVNVDQNPMLAAEYGVDAIPSLKVFKNGKVAEELVGLASKDRLREMITH